MINEEIQPTDVIWDIEDGNRQDSAYESKRDSSPLPPAIAARNALIYALHGVEKWRERGLWPPAEAQEELYRARVEAEKFGIDL